ncbi:MAG TPA: GatB/YqeY domain-containing protein [Saprospiraceae bacterium]|nr:GatB/YqeY domain-containing protein [Saprospiraceae bacterium]
MNLEEIVNGDLKTAMKAKDQAALRGIRAIKAAILLAKTDGSGLDLTPEREIQLLQKLVKQRSDSAEIYETNGRNDLAAIEREEIDAIKKYLPEQLEGEALEKIIQEIITSSEASSVKDMGKVMGIANKQLAGKADGKSISIFVKKLLSE